MRIKGLVVASLFVLSSTHVNSGIIGWNSVITEIFVDDNAYGGCMARVVPGPADEAPGCSTNYVSFNCNAEAPNPAVAGYTPNTKAQGMAKLSAAQLALVTATKLYVRVDDRVLINGHCAAVHVRNTRTPN